MANIHNPNQTPVVEPKPADKAHIRKIWMTALYLGIITSIEFAIAFTGLSYAIKVVIFVSLTIVKAFYIVAEFMHMKYETKSLVWSIILPTILIVWLLVALLVEGGDILDARI